MRKYIKKFKDFNESVAESPATKPAPTTRPSPTTKPGQPTTRPSRPSPIPDKAPQIAPLPKAKSKASEDDVMKRFMYELKQKGSEKVDMSIDYLKNKYTQEESVISDYESLVNSGDYSKEEAYQEIIGSYDEESLTPEVLSELDKLRKS